MSTTDAMRATEDPTAAPVLYRRWLWVMETDTSPDKRLALLRRQLRHQFPPAHGYSHSDSTHGGMRKLTVSRRLARIELEFGASRGTRTTLLATYTPDRRDDAARNSDFWAILLLLAAVLLPLIYITTGVVFSGVMPRGVAAMLYEWPRFAYVMLACLGLIVMSVTYLKAGANRSMASLFGRERRDDEDYQEIATDWAELPDRLQRELPGDLIRQKGRLA